ncbi:MAG: GIY-YIG nuclease family protein [Candidatus Omnitrophica bacterium]|nr:GIY-YIG nuclease family protein [Candidatus Omnitrophota bacterium]
MWYVYIVRCSDKTLYTGMSNNVSRRVTNHNNGKGAKYTRSRCPVVLVYQKNCRTRAAAMKMERFIKKLPPAKKRKLAGTHLRLPCGIIIKKGSKKKKQNLKEPKKGKK